MFGQILREAREAAGLTQEAVADGARIDRTYVSRLERGVKSPTVATLLRVADALGVPASELLARYEARTTIAANGGSPRPRAAASPRRRVSKRGAGPPAPRDY